jgi:general secretion pathway protein D
LIVVAPASIQPVYQKLIESLDTRRPQVMIEAKLIAVDTTDGFTLGIETAGGDREGAVRAFKFTSYGLSTVSANGNLALTPGRGFNGTIVDPEVADIVVRALANHSRSRVLSEPKLLVNDNDTGTLTSVVSVPFSSVNASNTVSTTSLGGTQEAGTTITVTPQINEDDNLQLEFEIEFSSFSGSGTATLPPARQIQTVSSVITIPDGQTVIVGGLKRIGARQEYAGIPWIEKIPLIRDLTGRTDESKETTSYFVFIRPLIVRDSRFEDLQFISDRDAGLAGIPSGYPGSQPLLMR